MHATMGDDFDYPPDDADETWHMHDDHTWGWGISCRECLGPPRLGTSRLPQEPPMAVLRHLKRHNELGMTAREEEREAIGDRWNDPKIDRVR